MISEWVNSYFYFLYSLSLYKHKLLPASGRQNRMTKFFFSWIIWNLRKHLSLLKITKKTGWPQVTKKYKYSRFLPKNFQQNLRRKQKNFGPRKNCNLSKLSIYLESKYSYKKKKYWRYFQMMCGTEPFPTDFKAKKYKIEKHFFMKVCHFCDINALLF
jgi:hypothetical protein